MTRRVASGRRAHPCSLWLCTFGALVCASCSAPDAPSGRAVDVTVTIDLRDGLGVISPWIYGVAGDHAAAVTVGATLGSWSGSHASRYNYRLGNAWNVGSDGGYRNHGVDNSSDLVGDMLISNARSGLASRVVVPAIGWVARDNDAATCSFPEPEGQGCRALADVDCATGGPIADPTRANVGSRPDTVAEWIARYPSERAAIDIITVGQSPDRWGIDHYDVHPTCPTYEEILGTYVAYARAIREASPGVLLAGPSMCCWFAHGDPPGAADDHSIDLLTWFLREVHTLDTAASGSRLIDVVDVQFHPKADILNSRDDADTASRRIEATRELWDSEHRVDDVAIALIPSVKETIADEYSGLPLLIGSWTFGATDTMSGAIAVAEALGIFARESVLAASHATALTSDDHAFWAFKLFADYDGTGGRFAGEALTAVADDDTIGAYAALDDQALRIVVVNRAHDPQVIGFDFDAPNPVAVRSGGSIHRYDVESTGIEASRLEWSTESGTRVEMAAHSIALVELQLWDQRELLIDLATPDSSANRPASAHTFGGPS